MVKLSNFTKSSLEVEAVLVGRIGKLAFPVEGRAENQTGGMLYPFTAQLIMLLDRRHEVKLITDQ